MTDPDGTTLKMNESVTGTVANRLLPQIGRDGDEEARR